MGTRATAATAKTPASTVQATSAGVLSESLPEEMVERVEAMITSEIPAELQASARSLLRAVAAKVAVAEHFDAFCGQAFSKPEWAAAASPLIAELFDHDEDQLAELARIPDLVIEMGSGQATVTCMVASRWAARGETHRLSRLAESIVASHASKNACAVEVMLALAATLAVTRFSRAEQLYNAALPLAGEEHQEALADARRWLASGRIVCSASQEERDFWDVRLRKPKSAWLWQSKEEREALDTLSERLTNGLEGVDLFKAVLPVCWWDLAMKCAQQQEKLVLAMKKTTVAKVETIASPRVVADFVSMSEKASLEILPHPQAGPYARFVLGWVCGAMAMAITVLMLPSEAINRVLNTFRGAESNSSVPPAAVAASLIPGESRIKSPEEKEMWRKENLQRIASEMTQFAPQQAVAKSGSWRDNELVLSGHSQELPHESPQYMKLLVWLHLDPPQDDEVRMRVSKLLLERVKADAITLWEELVYPGSANAVEIRSAAREALADVSFQWNAEEKKRLGVIAGEEDEAKKNAAISVSK
ncbi:hypothetical protein [Prosthecobacter sp.]|uniref:hypothetical protein n=1 Tax=Prosthecobacter sp. TaxID=1965333 RepID=UPI002AB9F84F|nr:hypothetical protein [Prosthecobacter sp.]MDZ4404538.1 hypothetical protein [Prosthecobacter sp.]